MSYSEEDSYETYLEWKRQRNRDPKVKARVGAPPAAARQPAAAPAAAAPVVKEEPVASTPFAALAKRVDEDAAKAGVKLDEEPPKLEEKPVQQEPKAAEPVTQKAEEIEEVKVVEKAAPVEDKVAVPVVKDEDSVEDVDPKGKEEGGSASQPNMDSIWMTAPVSVDSEIVLTQEPFDGKEWLAAFRQAKIDEDETRVSFLRRVVQRGTNEVLRNKSYNKDDKAVKLVDTTESVKRTTMYDGKHAFGSFSRTHQTTAHFVKADAVEVALFLIDRKNVNPVVLVMADEKKPGGHHEEGTCAQEECFYRRTTLKLNLEDPDQVDPDREWKYEIAPYGGIYAPDVQVFRAAETRGYEFLPNPKKVSFICASSLAEPNLVERKKKGDLGLSDEDAKTVKKKIEAILSIGLQNGHDAIVLSAFGCGYNKNPPAHMARLFREVITHSFPSCYRHVTFAIIDDENTKLEHNPEGNIKPFQTEFLETSTRAASKKCTLM